MQITTIDGYDYEPLDLPPAEVRWDTPRRFQGQAVEWQFAAHGAAVEGPGAPYARVTDHSTGHRRYLRLVTNREGL